MIYVNQKQLDQVKYLLEQSTRGFHVLFEPQTIRKAFDLSEYHSDETDDDSAEKHIENLILQPTLVSKRAYLENLDSDTYLQVVRTYFSIVENNIFETLKFTQ